MEEKGEREEERERKEAELVEDRKEEEASRPRNPKSSYSFCNSLNGVVKTLERGQSAHIIIQVAKRR